MKKQLISSICETLQGFGYTVYISDSQEYGFYTDGKRVVCFGGHWRWSVDFSGNYLSKHSGTGWQIATEKTGITQEEAEKYIKANAPRWATTENVIYTTPEQHLKTYGESSGYVEFTKNQEVAA
jgi:hypothetical protein